MDYDGTLIKNPESEFFERYFFLLSKFSGIDLSEISRKVMKAVEETAKDTDNGKNLFEKFLEKISDNGDRKYWENLFMEFYKREFSKLKDIITKNDFLVELIKNTDKEVIFASNPLFPKIAVNERIRFVDLSPKRFCYIAHMENSHFVKPDPRFFKEIVEKLSINPADCVMIGDTENDIACEKIGIKFVHVDNEKEIYNIFVKGD